MSLSTNLAIAAARDLFEALRSPHPDSTIYPLSDSTVATLKVMAEIFTSTFEEACNGEDEEPLAIMPPMSLPGENQPAKELPASEPRVLKISLQPSLPVQPPNTAPEPRVEKPHKIAPPITYAATTRNRNATRQQKMKLATPTPNKKIPHPKFFELSKLVTYTAPTPKSQHDPVKKLPSPTSSVFQQKPSATRRSR